MTVEEQCILLKNRINTLEQHYAKYYNALTATNVEHPEYFKHPVDLAINISSKLGPVPNELIALTKYVNDATNTYLPLMNLYETLKDEHPEYIAEKKFLYL